MVVLLNKSVSHVKNQHCHYITRKLLWEKFQGVRDKILRDPVGTPGHFPSFYHAFSRPGYVIITHVAAIEIIGLSAVSRFVGSIWEAPILHRLLQIEVMGPLWR